MARATGGLLMTMSGTLAGACGAGASGKSSGFITPDAELSLEDIAERVGFEQANSFWKLVNRGTEFIRFIIREHGIECEYFEQDTMIVARSQKSVNELEEEFNVRKKAGYETIFGDLMFGLDVPMAIHKLSSVKTLAALLMPVAGRLPFEWIYPIGEKQEKRTPKWGKYYDWATVIAGDCHYIKRFMPDNLQGKVIVTNTTTPEDVEAFRTAGVKYLITTTPVLEGRSFGTNMMEAALVAVSGKGRPLTWDELSEMLDKLGFEPQLQVLN
jgi:hypothetical protein